MTDADASDRRDPIPNQPARSAMISPIDIALLFARLGTASFLLFQTHDNVLSTERMEEFAAFLAAHGYPLPAALAPLVVGLQVLMAVLLLAGVMVRPVGLALMGMFVVALVTVHLQQPFNLWWPALALVQFGAIFAAAGGGTLGIGRRQPDRDDQIPS